MENIEFDWLDVDWASNHEPLEFSASDSPRASQTAERVDQPGVEHALLLLN
jgi:hypothetical protein